MKERTKETIRDGFGALINNASAMRGAKNGPLWLTIIFFVLSILLPVVPLFVAQANTKGTSFLGSYSYGLEKYVTSIALDLKNTRNVEFEIGEDHLLSVTENGNPVALDNYGSREPFANYTNSVSKQYDFLVYVSSATTTSDKKAVTTAISSTYYTNETTTVSADKEGSYHPSYVILFPDTLYVVIYNGTKIVTSSSGGDYKSIKENSACLATLLDVKDKEGNAVPASMIDDNYTNGVYANFKTFLNKTYENLKIRNMFATSGIYLAIFFGVSVLMGFLMWVLTRGKNNPNNYFTPWLTMKIQARLGLAPALITLIAGFFLTNYAPMIYIMTVGLRVMWISMKELRPIQQ